MRVSKAKLIAAFEKNGGLVTWTAAALDISRQAVYKRMAEDATGEIRAALEDIRNSHLDVAEHALQKNIRAGNSSDIRFYLETLGKNRGYTKRVETTGADGGPVRIDLSGISDADLAKLTSAVESGVSPS